MEVYVIAKDDSGEWFSVGPFKIIEEKIIGDEVKMLLEEHNYLPFKKKKKWFAVNDIFPSLGEAIAESIARNSQNW